MESPSGRITQGEPAGGHGEKPLPPPLPAPPLAVPPLPPPPVVPPELAPPAPVPPPDAVPPVAGGPPPASDPPLDWPPVAAPPLAGAPPDPVRPPLAPPAPVCPPLPRGGGLEVLQAAASSTVSNVRVWRDKAIDAPSQLLRRSPGRGAKFPHRAEHIQ